MLREAALRSLVRSTFGLEVSRLPALSLRLGIGVWSSVVDRSLFEVQAGDRW